MPIHRMTTWVLAALFCPLILTAAGEGPASNAPPATAAGITNAAPAPVAPTNATAEAAQAATNPPVPKLVCDDPAFDFGAVSNDQSVPHTFVLRNEGTAHVVIANVRTTCGCTTATLATNTLAPGQRCDLVATFVLRGRKGPQRKALYVESNDPHKPRLRLELSGTAVQAIDVEPEGVHFGAVDKDGVLEREVTLTAASNVVFHVTGIENRSPVFTAHLVTNELGRVYRLVIRAEAPRPAGSCIATIRVATDCPQVPQIDIPVAALVTGDLVITPPALVLYGGLTNAPRPTYVSLYAPSGKPFKILRVEAPDKSLELDPVAVSSNRYRLVVRTFNPSADLNGRTIKLVTDLDAARELTIPIRLLLPPTPAGKPAGP